MKKPIALFLAVCLSALSITACTVNDASTGTTSPSAGSNQTEQSTQQQAGNETSGEQTSADGSSQASSGSSEGSTAQSSSKTSDARSSTDSSKAQSSGQSSAQSSGAASQSSASQSGNSSGNSGSSNTGNSGSSNTGNSGSSDTGNTGSSNTGNSGSSNTGNSGSSNTGNSGSSNTGNSGGSTTTATGDIGGIALYQQLFNFNNTVTVEVNISQAEINKLQSDYNRYHGDDKKSDIYRMADVTFKVGGQSYSVDEVGVRLKGNQSLEPLYDGNRPNLVSLKLSFDEAFDNKSDYGSDAKKWSSDSARKTRKQRKFASMNELDLKWNVCYDQTQIREVYATKLFESADVLVQKIGLAQLKINGKNYGLVRIFEPIDKTFLEKRLPSSAIGGDLYKCMWSNRTSSKGYTNWRGTNYRSDNSYGVQDNKTGLKFNFNLKTNKSSSTHAQLKNFLNVINKSNPTKAEIESVLDVDYYARFMAASYFAGDPDDMRNNYNNHYIYFRKDNGKAIFIVYDNDRTLGITNGMNPDGNACSTRNPYSSYAAAGGEQQNPLISKTISHNPTSNLQYIRDKYASALANLASTPMLTSSNDFNNIFNTAKNNYGGIVSVSGFANQKEAYSFNLNASNNMTFDRYRSNILSTYKSAKP